MRSDRIFRGTNDSVFVEATARQWRKMYKALEEIKGSSHPGATFLSFHRDQMVSSSNRLLELGLDVSDLRNPRVVPVPVTRHPKTPTEARRWEAEISFRIEQHMLSFSVTGVGTHVVYSAVGDKPLVEVLARYVSDPDVLPREDIVSLISRSNLRYLALACSLWLLEPTGAKKSSAADLDVACFNRMLYAFEINPLICVHGQAKDRKLSESERLAAANAAAGWSFANLSLSGKPGEALRRALGDKAPLTVQYERFLEELPSASLIAWEARDPEEPLRSTGDRENNLARRVAATIEKVGNEDATRPGKLVHETFGVADQESDETVEAALGEDDQLLEEFLLHVAAEQELKQLTAWVEKAKLSEQQQRVYELDRQKNYDTAAVALELGVAESTVRVQRMNYTAKIRKAAGL